MTGSRPNENPLGADLEHILGRTRHLWEAARGRRIFITGGTGFFGRWLLESFAHVNAELRLGCEAVVLSRDPASFAQKAPYLTSNPAIEFVQGDIRSLSLTGKFDFVIHAATEASAKLNTDDPRLMFDTIVDGTRRMLELAVASGARRFLLTSSGAVYGAQPAEVTHLAEDHPGGPDCTKAASAYGEGKRAAEFLCASFHQQHGIEPLIARCFAFVGPFLPLDAHFAIGNFIRDALAGGPIRVNGDGTPYRSYLYAADLAIWLWTILFKGEAMRPYNVGSEDDRNIESVATAVAQRAGSLPVHVARAPAAGARIERYVPSVQRARQELGLEEWVSLDDAIDRTLAYHRNQTPAHAL